MTDNTKTWVHDNVEVTKTGRTAQNKTRSGKPLELVEITPVDQRMVGTWKKWVKDTDLYEVMP
jgi:hypothetical protein